MSEQECEKGDLTNTTEWVKFAFHTRQTLFQPFSVFVLVKMVQQKGWLCRWGLLRCLSEELISIDSDIDAKDI